MNEDQVFRELGTEQVSQVVRAFISFLRPPIKINAFALLLPPVQEWNASVQFCNGALFFQYLYNTVTGRLSLREAFLGLKLPSLQCWGSYAAPLVFIRGQFDEDKSCQCLHATCLS